MIESQPQGDPFAAFEAEPNILGFPLEAAGDDVDSGYPVPGTDPWAGALGSESVPAAIRRAERLGGLALVLAGVAAGLSLVVPWKRGDGATGLSLVLRGVGAFRSGIGELSRSGYWQPLAVVLGGGTLLLLGLLLFLRARTHRFVGVLALVVAVAAAAGVVVPLAAAGWSPAAFALGTWFAVGVAVLGLLGALKAMLTTPLVRMAPRGTGRARFGLRTAS